MDSAMMSMLAMNQGQNENTNLNIGYEAVSQR